MAKPHDQGMFENAWWTSEALMQAVPGRWLNPPNKGWRATGISIFAPAMQPGNMVCIRAEHESGGISIDKLAALPYPPAALIVSDEGIANDSALPVYLVDNWNEALLSMGAYVRAKLRGNIIGVTGSAGKTTCVAMLVCALAEWGPVCGSEANANLPRGVAWNIASMPWDTPHVVLEMAIGRMNISSQMVRPTVAVFTNIQAVHLKENQSLHDIARTKAMIFLGMEAGNLAVLNREMQEWDCIYSAAIKQGLRIVTYGEGESCDCRLLAYDVVTRRVTAEVFGHRLHYTLQADGVHMALNSVATLAVIASLGYPPEAALPRLTRFQALPGRGEVNSLTVAAHPLTVIDDAYNANPGSMLAAVAQLSESTHSGRKVLVLGEMAELGDAFEHYYLSLIDSINRSRIDHIYLIGPTYRNYAHAFSTDKQFRLLDDVDAFRVGYLKQIQDNDVVLFKGSNATRVWTLVNWLKRLASR
ncbi:UDP-N-acetylmuramoyl-tripeptide--D-alanyl-D-alanine ligase [Kluyvera sp. STS39-E]|uniref:UDP-N-acetylmuramoyl-tripeptide--D-alanyl-D- alanine ligase n=1 Tax=Kluyvera sp. STS39-E TaxID=3234748 RepID=UPI0034C6058B